MTTAEAETPTTTIVTKSKPFPLHEIVEVAECGHRQANFYLAHGYKLLAVVQWATHVERQNSEGKRVDVFPRDARYVLGRTCDVEPVTAPRYERSKQDMT